MAINNEAENHMENRRITQYNATNTPTVKQSNKMIFSYKELDKFLKILKKKGPIYTLSNGKNKKGFLLRHDVEISVELAYRMALIENKNNIQATFFFLTTSDTYNVLSFKNKKYIKEIEEMGHEIGLHFDPSVYGNLAENGELSKKVNKEARPLEFIINKKIKSISLHNPSIHNSYPLFKGYVNAYDPKIFQDSRYISDSSMDFRGKDIYKFIDNIGDKPMQILLHPFHYSKEGGGYPEIFWNYFYSHMKDIHRLFSINATYKKQLKKGLVKHIGGKIQSLKGSRSLFTYGNGHEQGR